MKSALKIAAVDDLKPTRTYVVHAGDAKRQLRVGVEARPVHDLPAGGPG